jgi:predicted ATPase
MTADGETTRLRLTVRNFRGVREASWAPEGVCALVGPNASGKSTLLEAWLFARNAALRTPKDAVQVSGGAPGFVHHTPLLDAPDDDASLARVRFSVEAAGATWTIALSAVADHVAATYEESLRASPSDAAPRRATEDLSVGSFLTDAHWERTRTKNDGAAVVQLRRLLADVSLYRPWELQSFRKSPWSDPSLDDLRLSPTGDNVFVVLQNWRDSRSESWRFDWVDQRLRRIHQRSFAGLELTKGGGALGARFYAPGDEAPLPIRAASNGILATLLTLVAVAGTREGGVTLLDEPDNGLHPSAIRALVEAFRGLHEERGIHVVLATHSPAILNAFTDTPEDVWVTERKAGATFPTRLTELCDAEWLANFRLGNLYGSGFGRQDPLSGGEA